MSKLELNLSGEIFHAELLREAAPKTCELFLKLLPLDVTAIHVTWSGESLWFPLRNVEAPPLENVNIYGTAGDMWWRPGDPVHEIQMVHGSSAFRNKAGVMQGNIFAKIDGRLDKFDEIARKTQREGGKKLVIKEVS